MHYLKCIEMLAYALNRLNAGQRTQVSIQSCTDIQMVLVKVQKSLATELSPLELSIISDVLQAIDLAQKTPGLLYLTDEMKNAMIDGINELRSSIAVKAFNYFIVNEFEPTEAIIPLMRDVVKMCLDKGVI